MMAGRRTAPGGSGPSAGPGHIPVLLDEVLAALALRPGATIIDGTFGAGGYTRAALAAEPGLRILAIDRDPIAVAAGQDLVAEAQGRLLLIGGRFGDLAGIAAANQVAQADGVVLDIGVSSMQLDIAERGFSFMADGPLDMRMGGDGPTAADLVNEMAEEDLADLVFRLGEERQSRRIARAIVRVRDAEPIRSTRQLARLVEKAIGRRPDDDRHPATRTFQALRIAVNDELGELARALEGAEAILAPGGRLVVVTFHSLEDRIVKRFLGRRSGRAGGQASRHGPPVAAADRAASFRLVNQRPVTPSSAELAANPRARSAKLRAAERTEAPAWPWESAHELGLPEVPDWS
jgi:16S rRNA (cytosine1402-N4)-methyltransferase